MYLPAMSLGVFHHTAFKLRIQVWVHNIVEENCNHLEAIDVNEYFFIILL